MYQALTFSFHRSSLFRISGVLRLTGEKGIAWMKVMLTGEEGRVMIDSSGGLVVGAVGSGRHLPLVIWQVPGRQESLRRFGCCAL